MRKIKPKNKELPEIYRERGQRQQQLNPKELADQLLKLEDRIDKLEKIVLKGGV